MRSQTKYIIIGALLIAFLMLLVPPWKSSSYALLFDPPFSEAEIDFKRLLTQLFLLGTATTAIFLITKKGPLLPQDYLSKLKTHHIWLRIGLVADCVLLLWALDRHPYDYYITLRCTTFFISAFGVYLSIKTKSTFWNVPFVAFAVIYNPIFRCHFERSTWELINVLTAAVFAIAALGFDLKRQEPPSPTK